MVKNSLPLPPVLAARGAMALSVIEWQASTKWIKEAKPKSLVASYSLKQAVKTDNPNKFRERFFLMNFGKRAPIRSF